jgi:hypothetical protein
MTQKRKQPEMGVRLPDSPTKRRRYEQKPRDHLVRERLKLSFLRKRIFTRDLRGLAARDKQTHSPSDNGSTSTSGSIQYTHNTDIKPSSRLNSLKSLAISESAEEDFSENENTKGTSSTNRTNGRTIPHELNMIANTQISSYNTVLQGIQELEHYLRWSRFDIQTCIDASKTPPEINTLLQLITNTENACTARSRNIANYDHTQFCDMNEPTFRCCVSDALFGTPGNKIKLPGIEAHEGELIWREIFPNPCELPLFAHTPIPSSCKVAMAPPFMLYGYTRGAFDETEHEQNLKLPRHPQVEEKYCHLLPYLNVEIAGNGRLVMAQALRYSIGCASMMHEFYELAEIADLDLARTAVFCAVVDKTLMKLFITWREYNEGCGVTWKSGLVVEAHWEKEEEVRQFCGIVENIHEWATDKRLDQIWGALGELVQDQLNPNEKDDEVTNGRESNTPTGDTG